VSAPGAGNSFSTAGPREFCTTSWGLVTAARDREGPAFRASLDTLFRKYWGPVFLFILRGWARNRDEAKDLTQAFFLRFFEKDFLASVDPAKGRFRNFVCAALRHFLLSEKRAARARKRLPPGGGLLSLEALAGEPRFVPPPDERAIDPALQLEKDWKQAVLTAALAEVHRSAALVGKSVYVDALVRYELERPPGEKVTYSELARELRLTENQVRNGLYWARKELKVALRREIEDQVSSEEDARLEARELFGMDLW